MKKKTLGRLLFAGIFVTAISCGPITNFTDNFIKPSAREIYERNLNNELLPQWNVDYQRALQNGVTVSLPYAENGVFNFSVNTARCYTVNLRAGEILATRITKDSVHHPVFIEVYQWNGHEFKLLSAAKENSSTLDFPVQEEGTYKLLIQPAFESDTFYFLSINKKPLYDFPVAGKSNAAVGSFWADVRDGGKRKHEGIDIFAKRGTPVIASADGRVTLCGERGIGGKQVWVKTGLFGNALYYAHLDKIAVREGQSVKSGDTLGFVGNTGNAKTTAPHLHFGIYSRSGAVDPLPFVYKTDDIKPRNYPRQFEKPEAVALRKINMRSGPSTNFASTKTLLAKERIVILGQHKDWLHVKTASGQTGFVVRKYVKPA